MAVEWSVIGILNLIRNGLSSMFKYKKYKKIIGYYLVCNQTEKPFVNSPERVPNFLFIDVSLANPNVLITRSKDFDLRKLREWKTWRGEIEMKGRSGTGYYVYDEGAETGTHTVVLKDENTIVVRVVDTGKAHPEKYTDNEPATQVWKKVKEDDPQIQKFKSMLK